MCEKQPDTLCTTHACTSLLSYIIDNDVAAQRNVPSLGVFVNLYSNPCSSDNFFPFLIPLFSTKRLFLSSSTAICRSLLSKYVQTFHCYDYIILFVVTSLLSLLSRYYINILLLLWLLLLTIIIVMVVFLVARNRHCNYCYTLQKVSAWKKWKNRW